jgi:hypothetical protein
MTILMSPLISRGDFVASIHRWLSRRRSTAVSKPTSNMQTIGFLNSGGLDTSFAPLRTSRPPRYECYANRRNNLRDDGR